MQLMRHCACVVGLLVVATTTVRAEAPPDPLRLIPDQADLFIKVEQPRKLIESVTEMNRTRGLTIHLVMFDRNAAERLAPLAEKNGGKCVVRNFETK